MKELHYYAKLLELGKISRREFIGRATALGVTVGLASTMAGKAVEAAGPKKGGHMRIGVGGGASSDNTDPGQYGEAFTMSMAHATRNYLTEIDREGKLVPELCTGWSVGRHRRQGASPKLRCGGSDGKSHNRTDGSRVWYLFL